MKAQPETTYYHVAGTEYTEGDDLQSRGSLIGRGIEIAYRWDGDDANYTENDMISLSTLPEANEFAAEFGGTIYRIDVPSCEDFDELNLTETVERRGDTGDTWPAIYYSIPSEWITAV